jgi:hypothetical protein
MKEKLLEAVRNILRKIVLPIRKKREAWLSNFRLSMAFRISIAYLKLLLTYGILFMVGFVLIYMYSEKKSYDHMADTMVTMMKEKGVGGIENPYYSQGLTMKVRFDSKNKEIYNDFSYNPASSKEFHYGIHFNRKGKNDILIIKQKQKFMVDHVIYFVEFQYDMSSSYKDCMQLLWKLVLLYLFIVYFILRKGKKSDVKLFEPLRIMSATANRLTVNNLHSERLNVEGTKNELKDLASVINAMLDRIETSYESQKQFVSDASH